MPTLRLAAAQLDTVVGDLAGNVARITEALEAATAAGADICVFPELAVTGYPPEDLLLKPGFVADNVDALAAVARASGDCVAVVGFVDPLGSPPRAADRRFEDREPAVLPRTALANAAAVCGAGRVFG